MISDPLVITGTFMLGASAGAVVTYAKQRNAISECRKALQLADTTFNATPTQQVARVGIRAFIVGTDPEMISVFSALLHEKGIETEKCFRESAALERLSSRKFEVLVLDFDRAPECGQILKHLPSPNKKAVVIAVMSDTAEMDRAAELGASFVIGRPLNLSKIREFLRSAYGRMLRDSQGYFRFAVQLPVLVRTASGVVLACTTLNVSQSGIAVMTPSSFSAGDEVEINFDIPGTHTRLRAPGNIIWDDKHGKAGIHFRCEDTAVQARYFAWLHDQFFAAREGQQVTADDELVHAG